MYIALGQYVRRMFDADIIDEDMAKRNFMAEFDEAGKFQRIFQVDYEKTNSSATLLHFLVRKKMKSNRNYSTK